MRSKSLFLGRCSGAPVNYIFTLAVKNVLTTRIGKWLFKRGICVLVVALGALKSDERGGQRRRDCEKVVGLHVPNCELFAGRSQYRPAGGNRVRLPLPAAQTNRPTKEGAYSDMVVAVLSFAK